MSVAHFYNLDLTLITGVKSKDTIRAFADTHLFSPIEILRAEILDEKPSSSTFLLGDIDDLANVAKDEKHKALMVHDLLAERHGVRYIPGNHERTTINNETIVYTTPSGKRVLMAHGDMEANPDKWAKYRAKPMGAGLFKRKFIIPFIREAEEVINRKPKADFLERAYQLCVSHNCTYYICGHFHPDKPIVEMYKGVMIIILPKGCTDITL